MNIKRRLTAIGLICSLMVLIFGGGRSPTTVYADTVEHTHIWATTYDSTNHWEYCTVCGEKRNVTAHVFTDHWYSNPYACGGKASNRTCDCGYGYEYVPQHVKDPTVRSATGSVRVHYWTCKNCGAWVDHAGCYNQNGALNCKNPGTCSVCGGVWPVGKHYIQNGRCVDCGKQIYKKVNSTQIYSDDYSTVTYTFDIIPLVDNMEVIASTCFVQSSNHSSFKNNFVKNDDGSYTIQWIFTIDPTKATIMAIPNWRYECVTVDGYKCYVLDDEFSPCWMDHTAPTISDIKQTDQKSYNGYATIKQLDISGTEDYANQITLSVSDKANGKVIVDNAKIPVSNDNWKYTCTPPLEAAENGRTYVVRTEDVNGNVSTKEFTIYKTDGTAPQVESPLTYTNWTAKAKTITLTISDYGSGSPQASLGDQTHYQTCVKVGDKYQVTYTFSDDIIGTKNYDLYLKDALGNATKVTLTVGNIDKNTYVITYNLNGGSSSTTLKTTYTVEDSFTLPNDLNKTGYTFQGWVDSNGSTANKNVSLRVGTRGNLTYTANFKASNYNVTIMPNGLGGSLTPTDSSISKNADGSVGFTATYNSSNYYALGLTGSRNGYKFAGVSSAADGGTKLWDVWGTCLRDGTYWNSNYKWIHPGNATLYAQWDPITWTIKYDANGGSGSMADTKHVYNGGIHITHNTFTRLGYSFNGWIATRVRNGKIEYLCGTTSNGFLDGSRWYEKDKIPSGMAIYKWRDNETAHICTYIDKDMITLHAQWTYNPIQVKIPQTVIGNEKGTSQFRVSCDNIKSGNINVSVPKTFNYTQSGKTNVTATISNKSGNNIITPTNKFCVYNVTTPKGLSAGCWQGIFNIGLTLTKE